MVTEKDLPHEDHRGKAKSGDEGPMHTIVVGGTTFHTTLTRKFLQRKVWSPKNVKEVRAFIPGVIQKVYVKQGAVVKKGDPLVVLEAMKMQNDIVSPMDATVKRIAVAVGTQVPKGTLIVELS